MRREKNIKNALNTVSNFFVFFLLAAFVTTCCIMLFVTALQDTLGRNFTQDEITLAAKITLVNVILISIVMATIDYLRRKFMVERPVKRITDATSKMMEGDFGVRIEPIAKFGSDDSFNEIIDCINKMAEELSGVETLRTDFIANVSHEMKTPLAVMQNYGKLLEEPDLPEQKRIEYARAITDASRRLSDMMANILKLNRLENQKIYQSDSTFDLGEQLCESLLQYESVWEKKNIEIETDIAEDVGIKADSELLSLVWNNLLSNAFKFTDEGGKVSLSLYADETYATVVIADTGCGMTSEVGAHIFEKFYQADSSRATQGNGLGLALVKRVVDIMGAEISVESRLGEGSTFTVRIRRNDGTVEENR
ncbi:MAG: HAMP domain-containing histidine kinase [Ruminococcaceae bacterium]|nr:HAMP domain-containing histidine kinase [Oscillospiraceae bacterium]